MDKDTMDRGQREVLRRKRAIIAEVLDFSIGSQIEYREADLLTDDMLSPIKTERTEFGRTFKWLELLATHGSTVFDKMTAILVSRGYGWLANEMYADLESERGMLQIEEYVFREAGLLIHKHYGRSKRLGDVEKKELQRIVADRYQAAKEGYSRHIREIQHQLDNALSSKLAQSARMRELIQRVHSYLRVEQHRLDQSAQCDINVLEEFVADPQVYAAKEANDYGEVLAHTLEGLLDIISKELNEKEVKDLERKRCVDILLEQLGSVEENRVYQTDRMLEQAIGNYSRMIEQARREADVSDKLAKSTEERFIDLKCETDRVLSLKEEQIIQLEAEIMKKTATILNLERKVLEEASEKETLVEDLEKWKKRYDMIERTRRIGYYHGNYSLPKFGATFRRNDIRNQQLRLLELEEKDHKQRALQRKSAQHLVMGNVDTISLNDSMSSSGYLNMNFKKPLSWKSEGLISSRQSSAMMTQRSISASPPGDGQKNGVAIRPNVRRAKQKECIKVEAGPWH